MSSNKKAKEILMRHYGSECFIEKLQLRKDDKPRRYSGKTHKQRMKQLTYHHIKMKKDGGKATRENGALLSSENHCWFHQQSPQAQGYMNAIFQEYKRQMDECRNVFVEKVDLGFEIKAIGPDANCEQKKDKYNRAKEKRETQKQIREALCTDDDTEVDKSEQKNGDTG